MFVLNIDSRITCGLSLSFPSEVFAQTGKAFVANFKSWVYLEMLNLQGTSCYRLSLYTSRASRTSRNTIYNYYPNYSGSLPRKR